jgi:hypothetical protein
MKPDSSKPPRAFISHSSSDKSLARRIARRLSHRDVYVWMDEDEMMMGDRLPHKLKEEILMSSHFLVLLTGKALVSRWVNAEIEIAQSAPSGSMAIIPIIGEAKLHSALLDAFLGVDLTDPTLFENVMDKLASMIRGESLSDSRDKERLRKDLDRISKEVPRLSPLTFIGSNQLDIADAISLSPDIAHEAETVIAILYELAEHEEQSSVAQFAANLFRRAGMGFNVIAKFIETAEKKEDIWPVFAELTREALASPELIDRFIKLFHLARWPLDTHFRWFVTRELEGMNDVQRSMVVSYMLSPKRGPGNGSIDLAYFLYSQLPQNTSLQGLWARWASLGDLVSDEEPAIFYRMMNEAISKNLLQFDPIILLSAHREADIPRISESRFS